MSGAKEPAPDMSTRPHEDMFATLADNISQLAWMADSDGSIFWYNKRWFDYTGATFEQMQGWGWTKLHHVDHVERVVERIRRSFETGEPWEDTFPLRAANGEFRWFLSRAMPIRDADGDIVRWFGTHTDISEQRLFEERLRESEAIFRAMFNNSSLGQAQVDVAAFHFTRVNEALCRLTGATSAELLATTLPEHIHPASRPALERGLAGLVSGEIDAFEIEARILAAARPRVWAQITLNTIVDDKGAPYRLAAVLVDVTERKLTEQRNRMLMREVNHRAKNLLAVVQAIARQTAGGADYEQRFIERVAALAAAHDVVVDNEWQGATLDSLILSQTGFFTDAGSRRIILSGPAVLVSAEASQMLAMTIYELAANAVKYGALSTEAGRVAVDWTVAGEAGAEAFTLEWRESGGPPPAKHHQTGFGSVVTRKLVATMFEGRVEAQFPETGFSWRFECALEKIAEREGPEADAPAGSDQTGSSG
ncbi:MAG TPA: PAS domain S-box protein [Rhodoblastus sp.]|nr:PAS domain S-box protein [Rhodoblastus sp.]